MFDFVAIGDRRRQRHDDIGAADAIVL